MRFLIVNTDYPDFLRWLYSRFEGLEERSYEEQMSVRLQSSFGLADFWSENLRKLGHEAREIHANNECLQRAWAREKGIGVDEESGRNAWRAASRRAAAAAGRTPLGKLKPLLRPVLGPLVGKPPWLYGILASQIEFYRPDVLVNIAMDGVDNSFLHGVKPLVGLLVGYAEPPVLYAAQDFDAHDLVLGASEGMVEYFRGMGLSSELLRFAFEPRVVQNLSLPARDVPVCFIGSLSRIHKRRIDLLEHLCSLFQISIWGRSIQELPRNSRIRQFYLGEAFGERMYENLLRSKIVLNCHAEVAGRYADNLRLYEATGAGALLITDYKENLHEIFELGKEVVAYESRDECAKLIRHYLKHDDEREAIAEAGRQRTLRDHTYQMRMRNLVEILGEYL